jgi:Clp amino terminal domain, pathogenicity island component
MTEFPVPLDNLITYVRALHPDGGPLDNLTDAFAVSARLDEQSDALIGYFVDQARKTGASWNQIGTAMGVTKQAAQKRFVSSRASDLMAGSAQPFSRFTPRAASVLAAAARLAADQAAATGQAAGQGETGLAETGPAQTPPAGPAHLAAALLCEPEGLAAKAIAAAGLAPEQVYAAVGAGPASPVPDVDSATLLELSFDDGGKIALKSALKAALRMGHNYIGTEHLLFGVLSAGGPVTDAFSALGLTPDRAEQLIIAELAAFRARREAG